MLSLGKLLHTAWSWVVAKPSSFVENVLHATSVGADAALAVGSARLVCTAHLQVRDLERLAQDVDCFAGEIFAARRVLGRTARRNRGG